MSKDTNGIATVSDVNSLYRNRIPITTDATTGKSNEKKCVNYGILNNTPGISVSNSQNYDSVAKLVKYQDIRAVTTSSITWTVKNLQTKTYAAVDNIELWVNTSSAATGGTLHTRTALGNIPKNSSKSGTFTINYGSYKSYSNPHLSVLCGKTGANRSWKCTMKFSDGSTKSTSGTVKALWSKAIPIFSSTGNSGSGSYRHGKLTSIEFTIS